MCIHLDQRFSTFSDSFVIGLSIYIKSRKVRRVQSLSHQRFSEDRDGELYFSTAHGHYFCLPICLLIILNTVTLIFLIVTSHGTALIFSVFCGRNFSRPIFLKFYFSYLSIHISYKSLYLWKMTRCISLKFFTMLRNHFSM